MFVLDQTQRSLSDRSHRDNGRPVAGICPRHRRLRNRLPRSNGLAQTPPVGWSSWNNFGDDIDKKILIETIER